MSYDLSLVDPVTHEDIQIDSPHFMRGGTYAMGGSNEASFNITYNYAPHLYRVLRAPGEGNPRKSADGPREAPVGSGIRSIYGLTGLEAQPYLEEAIAQLSDEVDSDYWKPAEGNVKRALHCVLTLSKMCPHGIWKGD